MEPFQLSLSQVNVEEQELGQSSDYESLYSFSNLVSFDSDFREEEDTHAIPVIAKMLSPPSVPPKEPQTTSVSELIQNEASDRYLHNFFKLHHESHTHSTPDNVPIASQRDIDMAIYRQRKQKYGSIRKESSTTGSPNASLSHPEPYPQLSASDIVVDANTVHMPVPESGDNHDSSTDSFKAFTDTVEALALQQSVIGKSGVAPASAEEIAAVLEATRRQMLQKGQLVLQTSNGSGPGIDTETTIASIAAQVGTQLAAAASGSIKTPLSTTDRKPDTPAKVSAGVYTDDEDAGGSLLISMTGGGEEVYNVTQASPASSPQHDPGQSPAPELIRIPPEEIVTVVEKHKSWFSGSSTTTTKVKSPTDSNRVQAKSPRSKPGQITPPKTAKREENPQTESGWEPQPAFVNDSIDSKDSADGNKSQDTETDIPMTEPIKQETITSPREYIEKEDFEKSPEKATEHIPKAIPDPIEKVVSETNATSGLTTESKLEKAVISNGTPPTGTKHLPPQPSTVTILPTQTKNLSADSLATEVERLLRERAKLEGHIEVLEAECSAALRERAQLQSQVAAVTQQLKNQEGVARSVTSERDALTADYETLRQNRARLEQVILDSNRLMEDKDGDITMLQEDLRLAKEAHAALQDSLKNSKTQVSTKEATISDMKGKIAELYVDFQTAEQNRILAENQSMSLQSENKTLQTGKEWYMEQLSLAQDAKASLQHDITKLKADIITQTTLVERTRADNVRLQTQLKETEQQALHEKEQLVRHLEAIEADMMEREATFAQIKQERHSIETLLQTRLEKGQEMSGEITDELNKAQMELKRRQAHIGTLEHERSELSRRLALSQESMLQRDQAVEGLEKRVVEVEVQLSEAQQQLGHKEVDMLQLQQDKMALEVELKAAKEEKNAFDTSLQSLKGDMGRVEASFRQMRAELSAKEEEVQALQAEREKLKEEVLRNLQVHNAETQKLSEAVQPVEQTTLLTSAPPHEETKKLEEQLQELCEIREQLEAEREKLREQVGQLEGKVEEVAREKTGVEQDLGMAQGRLSHMEAKVHHLVEEKAEIEGRLLKANAGQASDDQELALLRERVQRSDIFLQEEQTRSQNALQDLTLQLQTVQKQLQDQQMQYEESVKVLQDTLRSTETQLQKEREAGEKRSLQMQHQVQAAETQCRETKDRASVEIQQINDRLAVTEKHLCEERAGYEEKLEQLMLQLRTAQNSNDKAQYETALQEQSIKLQQSEHNLQQEKAAYELKLQDSALALQDAKASLQNESQKVQSLEGELLKVQAREAQLQAEADGFEARLNEEVKHRTEHMEGQLLVLNQEIHLLKQEKVTYEVQLKESSSSSQRELQEYKLSITQLEAECKRLRAELEEAERRGDTGRDLALELEKERGRLAGLQQTYTALREHSSRVEAALAARESSVMELSSHADSELLRQARELHALSDKLREVEALREDEKTAANQMKAQLISEKESHTKMRRELENFQRDMKNLQSDLEQSQSTVATLHTELEASRSRELQYKAQLDKVQKEEQVLRQTRDELRREVEERTAKDPVLLQQIHTLEWQLGEKQSEVSALQEQVKIVEDRQQMQITSLQATLQGSQSELLALRTEIAATKRDRNLLQAKVAELKGALRASVQHASLQQTEPPGGSGGDQAATPAMAFDLRTLEGLLKDPGPVTEQSKPLSVLQSTLSGLRGQISSLQSQVDQHTSAVQTSSMAWRELEAQVQDLREVCKTSAAERAASQSLMEDTLQLTGGATSPPT